MAWTVVLTDYPVVHLTNDEGNVAEVVFDETADPRWTLYLRYLGTAPETHEEVLALLAQLNG